MPISLLAPARGSLKETKAGEWGPPQTLGFCLSHHLLPWAHRVPGSAPPCWRFTPGKYPLPENFIMSKRETASSCSWNCSGRLQMCMCGNSQGKCIHSDQILQPPPAHTGHPLFPETFHCLQACRCHSKGHRAKDSAPEDMGMLWRLFFSFFFFLTALSVCLLLAAAAA